MTMGGWLVCAGGEFSTLAVSLISPTHWDIASKNRICHFVPKVKFVTENLRCLVYKNGHAVDSPKALYQILMSDSGIAYATNVAILIYRLYCLIEL